MNIIQIAGHLGSDVETRFTPDGQKVSTIRVATKVRRKGKEETLWWRVSLWGDRFDKLLAYLKKGSAIIVVGEFINSDIYTDRDGKQQVSLEIRAEFIRFSPFGRTERTGQEAQGATTSQHTQANANSYSTDFDSPENSNGARPAMVSQSSGFGEEDVPF